MHQLHFFFAMAVSASLASACQTEGGGKAKVTDAGTNQAQAKGGSSGGSSAGKGNAGGTGGDSETSDVAGNASAETATPREVVGGQCNGIAVTAPTIAPEKLPATDLPTPRGGRLGEGTYVATAIRVYGETKACGQPAREAQSTMLFAPVDEASGRVEFADADNTIEAHASAEYRIAGNELLATLL